MISNEPNKWITGWQLWDVNQYQIFRINNDGYAHLDGYPYTYIHDLETGLVENNYGTILVGQATHGGAFGVSRGFISFDLSSFTVPTGLAIDTIVIMLYDVRATSVDTAFNLVLVSPDSITPGTMVDTDYGVLGGETVSFSDPAAIITGATSQGWITINLNTIGIDMITPGAVNSWGIRSDRDIASTQPTGGELITLDGKNTAYLPRLIIKLKNA